MKSAKKICSLFLTLSLYSPSLYAADDSIFSRTFVDKLAECTPYEENKNYYFQDVEYQDTYKIIGQQDNNCLMEIHSQNQGGPKTIQICSFGSHELDKYVTAARTILDKKKPQNFSEAIEQISEFDTLELSVLQDLNCNVKREEWDPTKNIREALPSCQPIEEKQKGQYRMEYVRRIIGKNNEKCHYILEVWKKAPTLNHYTGNDKEEWEDLYKDLKDIQTIYDCFFDQEQIKQLIAAQKNMILPAYNSQTDTENEDEKNMDNFDPFTEFDFVNENCDATQNLVDPHTEQ
jgi:hypothetical protein